MPIHTKCGEIDVNTEVPGWQRIGPTKKANGRRLAEHA